MRVFTLEEANLTASLRLPVAPVWGNGQDRTQILPGVQVPPSPAATWWPPCRSTAMARRPGSTRQLRATRGGAA
jgi:hypothetical protein